MKSCYRLKKAISIALSMAIIAVPVISSSHFTVRAAGTTSVEYSFSGENAQTAGYAEGTVTLKATEAGKYYLYWADETQALKGYYEIASFDMAANSSQTFSFDYHTAIPSKAKKIIAVTNTADLSVASALAVYDLPQSKWLDSASGDLLYTFNSYSDVHIDENGYYKNATANWAQALKYGCNTNTDFIVTSGDMVTNADGPEGEWSIYEEVLANSDYVNPVWESDGNHDMRCGVADGLTSFVKSSGTDNTIENYDSNKPYYYVTEPSTGDIFIFMALQNHVTVNKASQFDQEQMDWLNNLLGEYYGTGVNIYIVEHSPVEGFGAGDRMSNPYYKSFLSESFISTVQFKSILQKYPQLIWMSGHTHEDLTMGYNYSNENGTACNMIHNPAVAGTTYAAEDDMSLDYNDGVGRNSQGYYVEAYENNVVYYGANLTDELIYPAYCYIMSGSRNTTPDATNATEEATIKPGATGSTIAPNADTKRVYFTNSLNWADVNCYSWTETDTTTCIWPGYKAVKCGTDANGNDLYYCNIPAEHTNIIWCNAGNGYQTLDTILDGTNNFFTPLSAANSDSITVTASVWNYPEITEPSEVQTTVAETAKPVETQTTITETTEPVETQTTVEVTTEPVETQTTVEVTTEPVETQTTVEVTTEPVETTQTIVAETTEPTTEPAQIIGDVNLDGEVTIADVTDLQKHLSEVITLSQEALALADIDNDGTVTIIDATIIQKVIAQMIVVPYRTALRNTAAAETLSSKLSTVKDMLDAYYTFSSYDQYQALKKLYYQYKDNSSVADQATVIAQFDTLIASLNTIVEHIGVQKIFDLSDIYYFENTNNWANVYCYAWTGSSHNAEWPGAAMQKVGTNYGHDVYGVRFDYAGQYKNVIFTDGTSQTLNISLNLHEFNCFYLDGSTDLNGKLKVGNFNFESPVTPTVAPVTTQQVADNEHYALCYYNSTYHGWSAIDTYFTPQGDGTYKLDFTATNSDDINLNVYDCKTARYNCIAASTSLNYASDVTATFALVGASTRGRSISLKGLSLGAQVTFVYNPDENTLTVSFPHIEGTEPTETTPTTEPATGGVTTTYTLYMVPLASQISSGCTFKANIKDSAGTYHPYTFAKTDYTYEVSEVYSVEITNPTFTDVTKIQFQTLDSTGAWQSQVVYEKVTSIASLDGMVMVCSSATAGTLNAFTAD